VSAAVSGIDDKLSADLQFWLELLRRRMSAARRPANSDLVLAARSAVGDRLPDVTTSSRRCDPRALAFRRWDAHAALARRNGASTHVARIASSDV
jgi:hypothetical protein